MKGKICRMGANIPVLVTYLEFKDPKEQILSGKATADEARRSELINSVIKNKDVFCFLNPNRTPVVRGFNYGYTLVKMADDLIADISSLSKMTGVNSLSQNYFTDGFEFDSRDELTTIIKDFYTRAEGRVDYAINSRIMGVDYPIKNFFDKISKDQWDLIDIIDKKKGTKVDRHFFKSIAGQVLYDDDNTW